MSLSWASTLSPWPKLHSSSLKSGVLTILYHDREHAPRARDHQVSSGLHFFKRSGALTIRCHDREQAIPARDLQHVHFQRSRGRSWSNFMIVSMPFQFVTPCRFKLQQLVTYVTIVSSDITTVSRHTAGFSGIIWKHSKAQGACSLKGSNNHNFGGLSI